MAVVFSDFCPSPWSVVCIALYCSRRCCLSLLTSILPSLFLSFYLSFFILFTVYCCIDLLYYFVSTSSCPLRLSISLRSSLMLSLNIAFLFVFHCMQLSLITLCCEYHSFLLAVSCGDGGHGLYPVFVHCRRPFLLSVIVIIVVVMSFSGVLVITRSHLSHVQLVALCVFYLVVIVIVDSFSSLSRRDLVIHGVRQLLRHVAASFLSCLVVALCS